MLTTATVMLYPGRRTMTAERATFEKHTHLNRERDITATAAEADTSNTLLYTE